MSDQAKDANASESITVVIRVRPMNGKEQTNGEKMCVEYDEARNEIGIIPTEGGKHNNPWTFDKVFGIGTEQESFYKLVAERQVASTFEGFNATIFAYGQTGSGKTFSMDGTREYPGIIPRSISQIFDTIHKISRDHPEQVFLVRVSYLEVYNENVHDLLGEGNSNHNHGNNSLTGGGAPQSNILQIKEDAKNHCFFVKDLTERVVENQHDVEDMINEGNRRRTVGKTEMNAESSRSHAIFTCWVERQYQSNEILEAQQEAHLEAQKAAVSAAGGRKSISLVPLDTKKGNITVGKLNLVDLAGSERGSKTGATGHRAKEGSYINKSLSALGDVIKQLEVKALSGAGSAKIHVPYRNSALTKLLSDSLGGNSKTVMIAACGPAGMNTEETVSTLRFAARVKAVKNKPKVNEDPKDAKLRELSEEIARLKAEQAKMTAAGMSLGGGGSGVSSEQAVNSVIGKLMFKVATKRLEKKEEAFAQKDQEVNELREKVAQVEAEKNEFAQRLTEHSSVAMHEDRIRAMAAEEAREEASKEYEAMIEKAKTEGAAQVAMTVQQAEAAQKDAQDARMRIIELEKKLAEQESRYSSKISAMEEAKDAVDVELERLRELYDQTAAARAADAQTFTKLKEVAKTQLSAAQARIDALNTDLAAAWEQQGVLSKKMKMTEGCNIMSGFADRWAGKILRKALHKWAECNISDYRPKMFPEQLGPFGMKHTVLTDTVKLTIQPEIGVYMYSVPLIGPLSDIARRFGDMVMDIGQTSPPRAITLSAQGRRFAGIPPNAEHVIWCYPLVGMAETSQKFELDLSDPALLFVTFGGYIYCDADMKVVSTSAIANGEDLHFREPQPWRGKFTRALAQSGRFQSITINALAEAGAKYYCWIHAGEVITSTPDYDCDDPEGSVEDWEVSTHGAFAYLFNEPDEPNDPRNCFFGVWGGSGDGSAHKSDLLGATTSYSKAFERTTAGMVDTFEEKQDMFHTIGHTPAPPPVASPKSSRNEPVAVAALKDDDYSSVIERAVFRKDSGALGMSISRSRTSGHLVVVNAGVGGEARSLGITVGCAVVEMNGEQLGVGLDDDTFVALLAALERPIILGFRRPKHQEEEMKRLEEEAMLQSLAPKPARSALAKKAPTSAPVVTRFDVTFPAGPLGMNLMVTDRGLEVKSVDDNGSAAGGGVVPGARIVAVQGEPLPDVPQSKLQAAFVSRLMAVPRPVTMTLEVDAPPPSPRSGGDRVSFAEPKKKPPPPKGRSGVAPPPGPPPGVVPTSRARAGSRVKL